MLQQQSTPSPAEIAEKMKAAQANLDASNERYGEARYGASFQVVAPKPWVELSIEEKIERTREQVKQLNEDNLRLWRRINSLESQARRNHHDLVEHRHQVDAGGRTMLPMDAIPKSGYYDGANECGAQLGAPIDPSKVYF